MHLFKKPWVYIASPYTKGDPARNVKFQMDVFNHLLNSNLVIPIAPLMSHFLHINRPREWEEWLDYDENIISRCDALLALGVVMFDSGIPYIETESAGRDREVLLAKLLGISVFYDEKVLLAWAEDQLKGK